MFRNTRRRAFVQTAWFTFLCSIGLVGLLIALLMWNVWSPNRGDSLTVYCAAGIRTPVEAVAQEYEKLYGVKIHLQYDNSQTLLASIEVGKRGDLYIPGDDYYIRLAQGKKMLDEVLPLAEMVPVIVVANGNSKKIQSLEDLMSGSIHLAQADPDAAAVGKLTRDALPAGQWDRLKKNTHVFRLTVNHVANDVKVGAVDAGIIWDSMLTQYPDLQAVPCPELSKKKAHVCVAVLKVCEQPTAALSFARYLAARDKGLVEFQRAGFQPVEGDAWAETPELHLFAGAMLQPAIKETLKAFEEREGIKVLTVYNGCGILVGQMKAGSRPDAYFACETSFMRDVKDLFLEPVDISTNKLVLVVAKGNPHQVKSLKDLASRKPGLKVGVGHETQCALGKITQLALEQARLNNTFKIDVRLPTGDALVNHVRAGSLDAVIVYISNAANVDDVEAYSLEKEINCIAVQPWAVGKESRYKQMSGRLLEAIRSAESRERFVSYGFGWKDGK